MNIIKFITHLIQELCTFVHIVDETSAWLTIAMASLAVINSTI